MFAGNINKLTATGDKMPQETLTFMQRVQEYGLLGYCWIMLISFWAGTARYVVKLNGSTPTFWGWLSDTLVSGFVGVVVAMTCQYYGFDFLLTSAITGICAHNGTRSLYIFGAILRRNGGMVADMIDPSEKDKLRHQPKKPKSGNK